MADSATPVKTTVFIVDDDEAVRRGLSRLVRSAGYQVETFSSAGDYLQRERYAGVGCILLDVQMRGLTGTELQDVLAQLGSSLPIVFLTGHGDIAMGVSAMKKGAIDFLTKPVDDSDLLAAIDRALTKHRLLVAQEAQAQSIRARVEALTPREYEAMRCIISGALNKQIAAHLGITEKTVKVHRARVFEKMEALSLAELVRLCDAVEIKPDSPDL